MHDVGQGCRGGRKTGAELGACCVSLCPPCMPAVHGHAPLPPTAQPVHTHAPQLPALQVLSTTAPTTCTSSTARPAPTAPTCHVLHRHPRMVGQPVKLELPVADGAKHHLRRSATKGLLNCTAIQQKASVPEDKHHLRRQGRHRNASRGVCGEQPRVLLQEPGRSLHPVMFLSPWARPQSCGPGPAWPCPCPARRQPPPLQKAAGTWGLEGM